MSRPRYAWWGYVKEMIRKYPDRRGKVLEGVAADEQRAVWEVPVQIQNAISQ